ncbi:MAG: hypothetical protein FWD44_00120 [Oscillospiraceae bacterium]|nr:hypothetical protein [Oscillospiraceae bacterium]
MAKRPVFICIDEKPYFDVKNVNFDYYSGFSISQKQKSIKSLHQSTNKLYENLNLLEISSKSESILGQNLSAFSLSFKGKSGKRYSVETTFQASKRFEYGGPYRDLLDKHPREAKRDERLKNSGKLIEFVYIDDKNVFPLVPKTLFYNWLYINTLALNQSYFNELLKYNAFTDIEFNPEKSINCQAIAAAIFVSLYKNNLFCPPFSKEEFLSTVYGSNEINCYAFEYEQLKFL